MKGESVLKLEKLKPEKYGLRVEGIIDPKDGIIFVSFSTRDLTTRTRHKKKIDPYAVAVDMEIEVRTESEDGCFFAIDIVSCAKQGYCFVYLWQKK